MIGSIYTIPELSLRDLPTEIPGSPGVRIKASDLLRPTPDQATASTFIFESDRGKTALQVLPPAMPPVDGRCRRGILAALLNDPSNCQDLETIERFLSTLGATRLASGGAALVAEQNRRFTAIESPDATSSEQDVDPN